MQAKKDSPTAGVNIINTIDVKLAVYIGRVADRTATAVAGSKSFLLFIEGKCRVMKSYLSRPSTPARAAAKLHALSNATARSILCLGRGNK